MGSIQFPNLGLDLHVGDSISIFGFEIAFYGMIIATAMICGALLAYKEAARTGQNVDHYIDYTIFGLLGAIIGARIYYVVFEWDYYSQNLFQILNLRAGGLAIYGGIIGAVLVLIVFSKVKRLNFFKLADTMVLGLVLGQIIGRWGNFFNREAYGGFTEGLFAMRIPVADAKVVNDSLKILVDGVTYVQVQPTFLYESVLNLGLLVILIIFRDKKKFYGETFCRYFIGYGIIRFFIEGMRTDQLQFHGIAVSQVLSLLLAAVALAIIIFMRMKLRGKPSLIGPSPEAIILDEEAEETEEVIDEDTQEPEAPSKDENPKEEDVPLTGEEVLE